MTPRNSSEIAAEQVTLVLDTSGSLILPSTYDKRAIESSVEKWQKRDFFRVADQHRNDALRSYVFT